MEIFPKIGLFKYWKCILVKLFLKVDINLKRFLLCFQYTINMGNFKLILGIMKTEIGNYLSSELATLDSTHAFVWYTYVQLKFIILRCFLKSDIVQYYLD